jgi:plasmid segregation protein ParM
MQTIWGGTMIVGVDWGGSLTKIATPYKIEMFPSDIIAYRKMKVTNELRKYDYTFEYNGRKGFAGTLARDERTDLDRNRRGDSKLHDDTLIRLLIALHQFGDTNVKVVVGQPINKHSDEKERIKQKIIGAHQLTVKNQTKTIHIQDVAVGVEGGSSLIGHQGKVHLIDVGSGTINFATTNNGRFINSESDTISRGIENIDYGLEAIAENIQNVMIDLGWKEHEPTYLSGGGAHLLIDYLHYPVMNPTLKGRIYGPEVANVIGFYKIGEMLWAKK